MDNSVSKPFLFAHFAGRLPALQRNLVENWLQQPANRETYFMYLEEWECQNVPLSVDSEAALQQSGRRHATTNQYAGLLWLEEPKNKADRRNMANWKINYIDADAYGGHGFVVADIDQDGDDDIVDANADFDTPDFEEELYWYENPGKNSPNIAKPWKQHSVWKSTSFYPKPQVGVGDVNGDGLIDLCTQTQNFVHVFLKKPGLFITWQHIEIKKPEVVQWIGEKWDHCLFSDVDRDGDIDMVGNVEEHYKKDGGKDKSIFSVVWFENPLK